LGLAHAATHLPATPDHLSLVVETLPQHRAFVRSDAKYQQLKKVL
jgi:hypothetical protein